MAHEQAWLTVWAKSERDKNDPRTCTAWLPLHQHLDDAAGVAGLLVDHWLSPQVLNRIGSELPDGPTGVRRLACWLAGVHDVGKCSPAFAVQVQTLADRMRRFDLGPDPRLAHSPTRRKLTHSLVGHLAVRDYLADELGFGRRGPATQWASVVGSHHGVPPERTELALVLDHPNLAGTGAWSTIRSRFLDRATTRAGGHEALARYRDITLSKPTQALLTAIVIMADWIASSDLFPLRPGETLNEPPAEPDDELTADRVAAGWAALNLTPRWEPAPYDGDVDALFRRRFDRPAGSVRDVQVAAVEMAAAMAEPGMVIIEAPMGSGKTEAALMAAEVLAHASKADGCFLALPTQATSDAMFKRMRDWLGRLPGWSDRGRVSVRLAHGRAHLNDDYRGLVRSGRYNDVGEKGHDGPIAHWWFAGRKKAGLASFVVGTIDQVLFAGLKSRHLMLRHLTLAGKVVIIDEVHAYDVYMSQYLHRVLHWLAAYRVPVVLLSATLPGDRRAELVRAYNSGLGDAPAAAELVDDYPLVSVSGGLAPRAVPLPEAGDPVLLDRLDDSLDTLVGYLRTQLADGGCAVVVRNTVPRVQETAERLAGEFGEDRITINHSRFLACDRASKDRDLLRRFGPPENHPDRPDLHIVVASQVVEQSLDVDFDLMVTDLAPVDLVLQRLGRLHRHHRDRPERLRQARCALVGVRGWDEEPVTAVRGSRHVYRDHTLLRAAAILADRDTLTLPHDIAPLVRLAYGDAPVGPPSWRPAMDAAARAAADSARERASSARDFLLDEARGDTLIGWLHAGVGDASDDPRGVAQVRDGEESLDVLVVLRDAGGGLVVPTWVKDGGTPIPADQDIPPRQARVIAACTLRLPLALSHGGIIDAVIAELERNRFPSFDRSPLLGGQLVLVLDEDRHTTLCGYQLTYDLRKGLIHTQLHQA